MRSDREMLAQFAKHVASGVIVLVLISATYWFFAEPWNQYMSAFVVFGVGVYMMRRRF